ncbi:MAG: phosphate ABC transporter ATP-binding protein, partial [Halobacteriota archaeon]
MTQSAVPARGSSERRLACASITHGFGGEVVLDGVTIGVDPGEVLGIIGPNATGKTTLLRLLAMFDRPDTGTVRLDGVDVWSLSERDRLRCRRRVAMVFQQANLFDTTVRRNVSYGPRVRSDWRYRLRAAMPALGNGSFETRVADALSIVDMADAIDREIASLSGGEAQRVAFARAVATQPDFLLLDEPTSDLDPQHTAAIEEAIAAARSRRLGVVVATHDMHQAERIADRVAVMLDGRFIEVGPVDRVFSNPEDP